MAQPGQGKWRRRALLAVLGIAFALGLTELGVILYEDVWRWRRFQSPPQFAHDGGNGLRIALLGGSTANGFPYYQFQPEVLSDAGGFNLLSVVEFFLEERYNQPVIVDPFCGPALTAGETLQRYWDTDQPKPDILVLYSGNNEWSCRYLHRAELPGWTSILKFSRTGRRILQSMYTRRANTSVIPPPDDLFRERVPAVLLDRAHAHYERCVEILIEHCRSEGILLLAVIPQGNHMVPPIGSEYVGPADRKQEALRLFKRAYALKYFEADLAGAQSLLEELLTFCDFSDLQYELGDLYSRQGRTVEAAHCLARARDTDAEQSQITSERRGLLRALLEQHEVPFIDMHDVVTASDPIPGDGAFLDDCHLDLRAYEALSREIIRALAGHPASGLSLPLRDLSVSETEWREHFKFPGGMSAHVRMILAREAVRSSGAGGDFLRLATMQRAQEVHRIVGRTGAKGVDESTRALQQELDAERERMRRWLEQ